VKIVIIEDGSLTAEDLADILVKEGGEVSAARTIFRKE
jgi:DNA-binding response OmpR family regulator